jgi:hypothetical protein
MRKLSFKLDLDHIKSIKQEIVPYIFTNHQYNLILKRFSNKSLTLSEKNEFSRSISKRMKAIYTLLKKDEFYVYGLNKMLPKRVSLAKKYIKQFSRKYKNKHIILTGSFLYQEKFNDIDIIVISKYEKSELFHDRFHITPLTEDVYGSIFYESVSKLAISNKPILPELNENISLDNFISSFQETFNLLYQKHKSSKFVLRDFILKSYHVSNQSIPDSFQLNNLINSIISSKNPSKLLKNIFVNSVIIGFSSKKLKKPFSLMKNLYKSNARNNKQHKKYYLDQMKVYQEVLEIAG